MRLSKNILIIESLSVQPREKDFGIMILKSRMDAKIRFLSPVTGGCFAEKIIIAENEGFSQNDALKMQFRTLLTAGSVLQTESSGLMLIVL